jgi:predicted component of type VI protein secretion system
MMQSWFKHGALLALTALIVGCGGSKSFSPTAVPIAVKMREALNTSNTSDIAGSVETARQLYSSGAITQADLQRFVLIKDLGDGNSWSDAKKILEEGIAGQQ